VKIGRLVGKFQLGTRRYRHNKHGNLISLIYLILGNENRLNSGTDVSLQNMAWMMSPNSRLTLKFIDKCKKDDPGIDPR
jgi:hypothetical protein